MENCKQNIGIENMKRKYPSLEYVQQDNECIFVGELVLNHAYNDVRMTGKFDIEGCPLGTTNSKRAVKLYR